MKACEYFRPESLSELRYYSTNKKARFVYYLERELAQIHAHDRTEVCIDNLGIYATMKKTEDEELIVRYLYYFSP